VKRRADRMDDNRLAKLTQNEKTNIPRPSGRPPKRWWRKLDINITGGTLDKIQNMVLERERKKRRRYIVEYLIVIRICWGII